MKCADTGFHCAESAACDHSSASSCPRPTSLPGQPCHHPVQVARPAGYHLSSSFEFVGDFSISFSPSLFAQRLIPCLWPCVYAGVFPFAEKAEGSLRWPPCGLPLPLPCSHPSQAPGLCGPAPLLEPRWLCPGKDHVLRGCPAAHQAQHCVCPVAGGVGSTPEAHCSSRKKSPGEPETHRCGGAPVAGIRGLGRAVPPPLLRSPGLEDPERGKGEYCGPGTCS